MKQIVFFLLFLVVFGACSKDDATETALPQSISYTTENVFVKNTSVNLLPTVSNFTAVSYSITPALPSGLYFNTSTGIITGYATTTLGATTYTITATDANAATISCTLVITVNDRAPATLSYKAQNLFVINNPVVDLVPTSSGGTATNYTITPALPNGLSINAATGVISGTPTATSVEQTYTVTAANISGSISFNFTIAVNSQFTRIAKMVTTYGTSTETTVYNYENNLISRIVFTSASGYPSVNSFTYQNGKLIQESNMSSGNGSGHTLQWGPQISTNFSYTGNLITSAVTPFFSTTPTTYGYNSSDQLVTVNSSPVYEYYPDGNVFKAYADTYYSYDIQNNPYRMGGFTPEYLKYHVVPFNNPTAKNEETYVYEYNTLNYPSKKTTYVNGVVTKETTYTYE